MHSFMAAILLRLARFDEFRKHPEPDPRRGELRQSAERVGGEGHTAISADSRCGGPRWDLLEAGDCLEHARIGAAASPQPTYALDSARPGRSLVWFVEVR